MFAEVLYLVKLVLADAIKDASNYFLSCTWGWKSISLPVHGVDKWGRYMYQVSLLYNLLKIIVVLLDKSFNLTVVFLKSSWLHDDDPGTRGVPKPWPSAGWTTLLEESSGHHPCWDSASLPRCTSAPSLLLQISSSHQSRSSSCPYSMFRSVYM